MTPPALPTRHDPVPPQHQVVPPERGCYPPPPPLTPPFDGLLIPAIHELVDQFVQAARDITGGPLPRLRSEEFLDAEPAVQLAVLLVAGSSYAVTDPHQTVRALLRNVSHDIHGGDRLHWRRLGLHHTRNAALVHERQADRVAVADQPRPHDVVPPPSTDDGWQDPAA